jgi:TatD DNase family protein
MYLPEFDEDRIECMNRAIDENVFFTLLPNIDVDSVNLVKQMLKEFPDQCSAMMGLHPCSVKDDFRDQLNSLKAELDTGEFIAVGEIGIDLYWDKSTINWQIEAFETQIEWAKEANLPIVIHARDSFREIFEVLDQVHEPGLKGVFHCFTGTVDQARKALGYPGFFLGMGGVLTFKNAGLDKVIKEIGPERVVLETDAPYLSPHPFRGKRNETAHTRIVADKLAETLNLSVEEVARITTDNAKKLFGLDEIY